ncbi:hypothetical protein LIER_34114 [Lithospermum erythrorhizon]|uniref:Secreted protein n=1 Tax=Lithospermum erythrorhizon TaxID=34254 RepID=A0AAV3S379_LITER
MCQVLICGTLLPAPASEDFYDTGKTGLLLLLLSAQTLEAPQLLDAVLPDPLLRCLTCHGLSGEATHRNPHHHHLLDVFVCL